jgi:hypothetical protein
MYYHQLFLHEVLEGIQPDVISRLQERLAQPFSDNIQIQSHRSALAVLDEKTYAIVCAKNPKYPEEDYLFVQYQKNPDDTFTIGQVYFLTPEEVVRMKKRGVIPLER